MGKKFLTRGVPARTRTEQYHRKGLWAMKKRGSVEGIKKKRYIPGKVQRKVIEKPFGKGTRKVVRPRDPKSIPTEPVRRRVYHRKSKPVSRVRPSLKPGTVLIVLSGRARGKRVVLLKVLDSGLLLITGPYKANGVPLRRINPSYVIATSTKVDISGVKLSNDLKDSLFKKEKVKNTKKKGAEEFFGKNKEEKKAKKEKIKLPEKKLILQKEVDEQILPIIKKEKYLFDYLSSLFTLSQGQYPHLMKF